jgi:hypothetical protein
MAQAARYRLDVHSGPEQLARMGVPEPVQLAELPPAPCRQRNRIYGPAVFVRHHVVISACPSTGRTTGACPGYIKDHAGPASRELTSQPQIAAPVRPDRARLDADTSCTTR